MDTCGDIHTVNSWPVCIKHRCLAYAYVNVYIPVLFVAIFILYLYCLFLFLLCTCLPTKCVYTRLYIHTLSAHYRYIHSPYPPTSTHSYVSTALSKAIIPHTYYISLALTLCYVDFRQFGVAPFPFVVHWFLWSQFIYSYCFCNQSPSRFSKTL